MRVALRVLAILVAALNAGYMLYDGSRALIAGDYLRPASGEYAGQLGPWTMIVEAIGIDPMSTAMKSAFVAFGALGLVAVVFFALRPQPGTKALLAFSIATAWNLVLGTLCSALQIALILSWARLERRALLRCARRASEDRR